jgi:glycosyltransferase involved in cell wall biosynthesis
MWTNKQHIMSRLARTHRVLHVNFGARNLTEHVRERRKQRSGTFWPSKLFSEPLVREDSGVTLLDFALPLVPKAGVRYGINRHFLFDHRLRLVERYLARQNMTDAILWVYHPGYGAGVAALPHRLVVYDCVDEYTEFPDYRPIAAWLSARESELCRAADVVFTTSEGLFERKRSLNPEHTHLVHNVGDFAHFSQARADETVVPADLAALPNPVVGFVGAVSDYKLDTDWLIALSQAHPEWSLVVVGPVGLSDRKTDVARLRACRNVHLLGHRPYAELPAYVKGFDLAVIPYRDNEYTRYVFPIKFFEFLASGKPVVVSDLPALREFSAAVRVAKTAEEFVRECEQALGDPALGREQRIALAARNTWDDRVARLLERVEARLTD